MNRKQRRSEAAADPAARAIQLNLAGVRQLERGDAEAAAETFRSALRLDPGRAETQVNLSRAYARLGRLEAAEELLRLALAAHPEAADLHGGLGSVLDARQKLVPAIESYRRALELAPGHWAATPLEAAIVRLGQSVHSWHLPMLADDVRNAAYDKAIAAAVGPEDVVLDIGTGSGLLAMMAARAGAHRVFGCEMVANLADLAERVVGDNGFADRISILPQASTALPALPEPATLLVTETFDSLIVGEGVLDSLAHAHRHLLAPGARVIPAAAVLKGQLATLPRLKALHPLDQVCGFDLRAFSIGARQERFFPVFIEREHSIPLSAPVELARFDFTRPPVLERTWTTPMPILQAGTLQVLLLWFDLHLDADTVISSGPGGGLHHWNPVAFLFERQREVTPETRYEQYCHLSRNALYFEPEV
jgi:Flp pilus assembly protein TadD/precorrin-6B methylase 2